MSVKIVPRLISKFTHISDLITTLQDLKDKEGDLIVTLNNERMGYPVGVVTTVEKMPGYETGGTFKYSNDPDNFEKIVVIRKK